MAQKMSAGLELFICDYDPNIAAGRVSTVWIDQPAREHLLSILQQKLESLAEPLRARGLDVATDTSWDHPLVDGIVRKIAASKPWTEATTRIAAAPTHPRATPAMAPMIPV